MISADYLWGGFYAKNFWLHMVHYIIGDRIEPYKIATHLKKFPSLIFCSLTDQNASGHQLEIRYSDKMPYMANKTF